MVVFNRCSKMSGLNQNIIRQYAGNLREIQTLYETCPIYARPSHLRRESAPDESVLTGSIFSRDNAETLLKACERYWHFSLLQRQQANEFLIKEPPGSFIVRKSKSKNNSYALSIRLPPRCADPVTHYLILHEAEGYTVQGSKLPFPSLYALLAHFCFKQSGGMPCLLRPPNVPISKRVLEQEKQTYASIDELQRARKRLDGRSSTGTSHKDDKPPPLPPPRKPKQKDGELVSHDQLPSTSHEDICIVKAESVESSLQEGQQRSRPMDRQLSRMFDRLTQRVADMLNGESSNDMDDIEDFELEVSASDDSGDEGESHRVRSATLDDPSRGQNVSEAHSPTIPSRQSTSSQGSKNATFSQGYSTGHIPSHDSPILQPRCSPSPIPPIPPRSHQVGKEPSHSPSSTFSSNSRTGMGSPKPPRPPKPYHLTRITGRNSPELDKKPVSVANRRSISDSSAEQWQATQDREKLSGASNSVAGTPIALSKPNVDILQSNSLSPSLEAGLGKDADLKFGSSSEQSLADTFEHPEFNQSTESGRSKFARQTTRSSKKKKKTKKLKLLFHVRTPAEKIKEFIVEAAEEDTSGPLSRELTNFCNRVKSHSLNYQTLLQETRQCMDDMRKMLLKDYSGELEKRGKKRCKLFDEIIERSLQEVVLESLYPHIVSVMEEHFNNTKSLQLLQNNTAHGRKMKPSELGIRDNIVVPDGTAMAAIAETLSTMEKNTSAMRKLELLLEAVKLTYDNIRDAKDLSKSMKSLGADDFLPIFVWVLLQCQFTRAELEAEFMWGLVHPSLLNGEGGYYLTTLTSAVEVVKQLRFDNLPMESVDHPFTDQMRMSDSVGLLQVFIEDPVNGSRETSALIPVPVNMDAGSVCQLIEARCRDIPRLIPFEYALYVVEGGKEIKLSLRDCPQAIKTQWPSRDGINRYFGYLKNKK